MRIINNGLIYKFVSIENCVYSLIGIQCQYQNYGVISIYNRIKNKKDISSIYLDNSLIKSWGQRTTLHIYTKKDYNVITELSQLNDNWVIKYCKKLSIDYKKYLKAIVDYFEHAPDESTISSEIISNIIPCENSKEIMSWSGLLILATNNRIVYGVLNKNNKKIYNKNDIPIRNVNFESVFFRYFKFFGPATKKDFYHWLGYKNKMIDDMLNKFLIKIKTFKYLNDDFYYVDMPKIIELKYPIILGKFDPLLVSYKDKKWILKDFDNDVIWKKAGHIEGVIIFADGLKATWHYAIKNNIIFYYIKSLKYLTKNDIKKIDTFFKDLSSNIYHMNYKLIID